ncbi:MYND Zn-finger protein [Ceratobasidium sp. AG-Ba]|nr:MYND Zn-finger protein [Ceratobasidium sp. AG-Ba]
MADQDFLWGPRFDEYSQRKFDPFAFSTARATYEESMSWLKTYGILPLNAMIATLQDSDPRVDRDKLVQERDLQVDYQTIYKYAEQQKHRIFERYYGFVAFRRLLHSISLAILEETDSMGKFIFALPSHASWGEMSQLAAFMALEIVAQEPHKGSDTQARNHILSLPILEMTPDMPNESSLQILISLWTSRARLITLCLRGYFPGCAILLRLLYFRLAPEVSHDTAASLFLQDIASRLYLVGSHRDRQILAPICMLPVEKDIHWPTGATRFANAEDSAIIVNAYSGLLLVWRQDSSRIESLSVEFMCHLIEFTLHVTVHNPASKLPEALDAISWGLRTMWLLFEHYGRIPLRAHSDTRRLAIYCFGVLKLIEKQFVKKQGDRQLFAQMLAANEFLGLITRVILLVTDEGNEFKDTGGQHYLAEKLEELEDTVNLSVIAAPEVFVDSSIEWFKVLRHLWAWVEMWTDNKEEQDLMGECALQPWGHYGKSINQIFETRPQGCANPRCFEQLTHEGSLRFRLICGGCKRAAYCDIKCQQAHWQLATVDSHKRSCIKQV